MEGSQTGKSTSSALIAKHTELKRKFELSVNQSYEERKQALQDRRFYSIAGAQYEGEIGDLFKNKPKIEINKGHSSIIRIFNDYRSNRITVDYISKDGEDRSDLADTCDRLYRADEMKSSADEAYDNAFEEAVGGGMGAWRYRADLQDEYDIDNKYQTILIEPIFDADSCVFFNADAMRQDKSDASECWVLKAFTLDVYKEKYDDDPSSWPKEINTDEFNWSTPDKVWVAETYQIEKTKEEVNVYEDQNGEFENYSTDEFEIDPDLKTQLALEQKVFKETKTISRKRVHKYILSGSKIVEDAGYVAGTEIPIVPIFGKRWVVDGIERMMGHIRLSKDPQRVKNATFSKLLEISALSSVEKPIVTPEQMSGHWSQWSTDNIENWPALLLNSMTDKDGNEMPPSNIPYTKVPNIPPALAAIIQLIESDLQDILGNQKQGDKIVSNISDEAIERVQNRLDMQSLIYMSNFAKGMRRGGQIWLAMARDLYIEQGRKMMALSKENKVEFVELMKPVKDDTGKVIYKNDLRDAKFEIMVDIGPSFASKRQRIISDMTNLLYKTPVANDQETASILFSIIMMNLDGEGMQGIREFYRKKLIKLGVEKPTEEEAKALVAEQQAIPPDANAEYLKAAGQNQLAKAQKTLVDIRNTLADTQKKIADTVEVYSKIDRENKNTAKETAVAVSKEISGNQAPAQVPEQETGTQPPTQ